MTRRNLWTWLVVAVALSPLAATMGCGGADPAAVTADAGGDVLPADLLAQTWPMSLATQADQDALTSSADGWIPLIVQRNYRVATQQLGRAGGLPSARAHADMSALYRQAALLAAFSFINTYEERPEPTDPVGTAHLLAVSYAMMGDLDKARTFSARLDAAPGDPTAPWHAPWKAWLAGPAPTWPPDLSSLPLGLPAPTPGETPDFSPGPHYAMPEQGGATTQVDMADPAALWALALWHEQAAKAAAPGQDAAIDTYLVRYRLPVEADVAGVPLPRELIVGSDYLVPEDGPFMADLLGAKGVAAVDDWAGKSALATLAASSRQDGKFTAELAGNLSANLRQALEAGARSKNGGQDNAGHRTFADIAQAGTMRSLAFVAEVETIRKSEESGKLRILAMEMADAKEGTGCPAGLMSLAAWDAGNGYTLRAAEILHDDIRRYPSVEAARYALDVLALRRSRQGPNTGPTQ